MSGQGSAEVKLLEAVSSLQELGELTVGAAELAQRASKLRELRVQLRLPEAPEASWRFEVALRKRVDVKAFSVDVGTWKWLGTAVKAVFKVEKGRVVLELYGDDKGSQGRVFWVQLDNLTLGELLVLAQSLDEEDWKHITGELGRIKEALAEYVEQLGRAAAAVKLVL